MKENNTSKRFEREFPHQFVERMLSLFNNKIEAITDFSRLQQVKVRTATGKSPISSQNYLKVKNASLPIRRVYPEPVYLRLGNPIEGGQLASNRAKGVNEPGGIDAIRLVHSRHLDARESDSKKKKHSPQGQNYSLTPAIESMLSKWLKIKLPPVYLHQNARADQILEKRRADAMTIGNHVYFQTGKYDPQSPKGLALIAHELTHVVQQTGDGGEGQYPGTDGRTTRGFPGTNVRNGVEHQALENERFVYRQASSVEGVNQPVSRNQGGSAGASNSARPSQTAPAVMFADTSRDMSSLPAMDAEPPNAITLSESEMMRIKEEVYRDLMMRIKIDFERGA